MYPFIPNTLLSFFLQSPVICYRFDVSMQKGSSSMALNNFFSIFKYIYIKNEILVYFYLQISVTYKFVYNFQIKRHFSSQLNFSSISVYLLVYLLSGDVCLQCEYSYRERNWHRAPGKNTPPAVQVTYVFGSMVDKKETAFLDSYNNCLKKIAYSYHHGPLHTFPATFYMHTSWKQPTASQSLPLRLNGLWHV